MEIFIFLLYIYGTSILASAIYWLLSSKEDRQWKKELMGFQSIPTWKLVLWGYLYMLPRKFWDRTK